MYEGEDVNTIDLLYESETTQRNGTKVIVPVRHSDRRSFYEKIKEQLAYFENVYFDVTTSGPYSWSDKIKIDNNFSILRHELFQKSDLSSDKYMHLCLDNVYYPMDFNKLGIDKIEVPVGLRFGLTDGIFPTPNRESIRYTQEAKETILQKIKDVSAHLVGEFNNSMKTSWGFHEVLDYYTNKERILKINNLGYDIKDLAKHSNVSFNKPLSDKIKLIDLEHIITKKKSELLSDYLVRFEIKNNYRFAGANGSLGYYTSRDLKDYKFYIFKDRISNNMKEYMKHLLRHDSCKYKFVKKVKERKLLSRGFSNDGYIDILHLHVYPRNEWRDRIKEFQYFESLATSQFIDLDKVKIDDDWLQSIKIRRSRSSSYVQRGRKLEGEVVGKEAKDLERFVQGQDCKFEPTTYKLENIHKTHRLIIYSNHDDKNSLDSLYKAVEKQKIKLVTFSDREVKRLTEVGIHNLITYKEFMKGENKPFKRIITAYLIDKLTDKYQYVFNNLRVIKTISVSMFDKLSKIMDYGREHHNYNSNSKIYEAMLEVAENNNLFDYTIYPEYLEIKGLLEKLDFLNPFLKSACGYNSMKDDDMHSILCSLFKYYKHRIDYTNYNIKVDDSLEISEEVVDELVNN